MAASCQAAGPSYTTSGDVNVVGGPGTGKTSILLSVLKDLSDLGDYPIHLSISDELKEHIGRCLPMVDLTLYTETAINTARVVLLDDPYGEDDIVQAARQGRDGNARIVVVALDPLQLAAEASDDRFAKLARRFKATEHTLHTCYRQKRNVGMAAMRVIQVIAESTPFLHEAKVRDYRSAHAGLTGISNNLEFPNPLGYAQAYIPASCEDLQAELDRILHQPGGLWAHTTPLLVAVLDRESFRLPRWFAKELAASGITYKFTGQFMDIKGLEFQHVFVVASQGLLVDLEQGFSGTGRSLYSWRRLLRIPFTRGKDSVVTFGLT